MVTRKKDEFEIHVEKQYQKDKKIGEKLQGLRVDWDREIDKKAGKKGLFPCTKCGSEKTFTYEQPTENEDDMVIYYTECMECNYKMR